MKFLSTSRLELYVLWQTVKHRCGHIYTYEWDICFLLWVSACSGLSVCKVCLPVVLLGHLSKGVVEVIHHSHVCGPVHREVSLEVDESGETLSVLGFPYFVRIPSYNGDLSSGWCTSWHNFLEEMTRRVPWDRTKMPVASPNDVESVFQYDWISDWSRQHWVVGVTEPLRLMKLLPLLEVKTITSLVTTMCLLISWWDISWHDMCQWLYKRTYPLDLFIMNR